MLESFFGRLLSTFLGRFFTLPNSDDSQSNPSSSPSSSSPRGGSGSSLTMSVWSGFVELKDLVAKLDVINDLVQRHCAALRMVKLRHLTIGRLELSVPWSSLGSKPVVIVIDSIHVVAETDLKVDSDPDSASSSSQQQLNDIQKRLQLLQNLSNPPETPKPSFSLLSWLAEGAINKIVDTIQIHVRDVHFRWEDSQSCPSKPFAFGVTVESLHINSSSNDDVSPSASANNIHKMIQLNHLSVYHDQMPPETRIYDGVNDQNRINKLMSDLIPRRSNLNPLPHSYILRPVNINSTLTLRRDFDEALESIKTQNLDSNSLLSANVNLSAINVQISNLQTTQTLTLLKASKHYTRILQYNRWRPPTAQFVPREWWMYAINCILYEVKKRLKSRKVKTLSYITARGRWRKEYCGLYEKHLNNEKMTKKQREKMAAIEEGRLGDLTVDDIFVFRTMVHRKNSTPPPPPPSTPANPNADADTDADGSLPQPSDLDLANQNPFFSFAESFLNMSAAFAPSPASENERMLEYLSAHLKSPKTKRKTATAKTTTSASASASASSPSPSTTNQSPAIKINLKVPTGSITFLSEQIPRSPPLPFLEFNFHEFLAGYELQKNLSSFDVQLQLRDVDASEVGVDGRAEKIIWRDQWTPDLQSKPLFLLNFRHKPSDKPQYDNAVESKLEKLHVLLSDNISAFREFKQFIPPKSSKLILPSRESYYNYYSAHASSSSFYSRVHASKSRHTKFNAASPKPSLSPHATQTPNLPPPSILNRHSNIYVSLSFCAPLLTLGDPSTSTITVDFGSFTLKNNRVAGVGNSKMHLQSPTLSGLFSPQPRSNDADAASGGLNTAEKMMLSPANAAQTPNPTPTSTSSTLRSPMTKSRQARTQRAHTDSFSFSETASNFTMNTTTSNRKNSAARQSASRLYQANFYDTFSLTLSKISIRLSGNKVIDEFNVNADLWRSVIPQDPTMSKFKISVSVDSLVFNVDVNDVVAVRDIVDSMSSGMMRMERRKSEIGLPEMFAVPMLPTIGGPVTPSSASPYSRTRALHEMNLDEHVDSIFNARSHTTSYSAPSPDNASASQLHIMPTSTFASTFGDELMEFEDADQGDQDTSRSGSLQLQNSFFQEDQSDEFINPTFLPATRTTASSRGSHRTPSVASSAVGYLNSENLARLDVEYAVSDDGSEESFHSAVDIDLDQVKVDIKAAIRRLEEAGTHTLEDGEREAADLRALLLLDMEIEEEEKKKEDCDPDKLKQSALRAKALLRFRSRRPVSPVFVVRPPAIHQHTAGHRPSTPKPRVNRDLLLFTLTVNSFMINMTEGPKDVCSLRTTKMSASVRFRSEDIRSKITLDSLALGVSPSTYLRGIGISDRHIGLEHELSLFSLSQEENASAPKPPFFTTTMERVKDEGARCKVAFGSIDCSVDKAGLSQLLALDAFQSAAKQQRSSRNPPPPSNLPAHSPAPVETQQLASLAASFKLSSYKLKLVNPNGSQALSTSTTSIACSYAQTQRRFQILASCGGASLSGPNNFEIVCFKSKIPFSMRIRQSFNRGDENWVGCEGVGKNVVVKVDEVSVIIGATEIKNVLDVVNDFKAFLEQHIPSSIAPNNNHNAAGPPTRFDLVLLSPSIVVPEKRPSLGVATGLRNRASPTRGAFGPSRGIVFFSSKISVVKGVNSEATVSMSLVGGGVKSLGRSDFESGVTNVTVNAAVRDGETRCEIGEIGVAMTTDFVEAIRCCSSSLKVEKGSNLRENSSDMVNESSSSSKLSFPQFHLTVVSLSLSLSSLRFEMKSIMLSMEETKLAFSVDKVECFNSLSGINFFQRTTVSSPPSPLISVNVDLRPLEMEVIARVRPFAVVLCVECVEEVVNFSRGISSFTEDEGPLTIVTEENPSTQSSSDATPVSLNFVRDLMVTVNVQEVAFYVPCYAPRHLKIDEVVDLIVFKAETTLDCKVTGRNEVAGKLKKMVREGKEVRRVVVITTDVKVDEICGSHAAMAVTAERNFTPRTSSYLLNPFSSEIKYRGVVTEFEGEVFDLCHRADVGVDAIEGKVFLKFVQEGGEEGDRAGIIKGCIEPILMACRKENESNGISGDGKEGELMLERGAGEGSASVPMATPGRLTRRRTPGGSRVGRQGGKSPMVGTPRTPKTPLTLGSRTPVMTPMTAISLISEEGDASVTSEKTIVRAGAGANHPQNPFRARTALPSDSSTNANRASVLAAKKPRTTFRSLLANSIFHGRVFAQGLKITMIPGSLLLYSDSPLLRIIFDNIKTDFCSFKGVVASTVDFEKLQVEGMNRGLVAWEPVVESWGVKVFVSGDMLLDADVARTGRTRIASRSGSLLGFAGSSSFDSSNSGGSAKVRSLTRRVTGAVTEVFSPIRGVGRSGGGAGGIIANTLELGVLMVWRPEDDVEAEAEVEEENSNDYPSDEDQKAPFDCAALLRTVEKPSSFFAKWMGKHNWNPEEAGRLRVSLEDNRPLNINITSALLSHLLMTLKSTSKPFIPGEWAQSNTNSASSSAVPLHWIRNCTGTRLTFWEEIGGDNGKVFSQGSVEVEGGGVVPLHLSKSQQQANRRYIALEVGSGGGDDDRGRGLSFRRVRHVPVDKVGVYKYPLRRKGGRSSGRGSEVKEGEGAIVVRVMLVHGGTSKMVSVESCIKLRNVSSSAIDFELKTGKRKLTGGNLHRAPYFVPVQFTRGGGVDNVLVLNGGMAMIPLSNIQKKDDQGEEVKGTDCEIGGGKILNVVKGGGVLTARSPWKFKNFLPLNVLLQVKSEKTGKEWKTVRPNAHSEKMRCGDDALWERATSDEIWLRVKFCDNTSQFPGWSTPVRVGKGDGGGVGCFVGDENGVNLKIGVVLVPGGEEAARKVSLYVPYWIIDSTGVRLEYVTRGKEGGERTRTEEKKEEASLDTSGHGQDGQGGNVWGEGDKEGFEFVAGQVVKKGVAGGSATTGGVLKNVGLKTLLEGGDEDLWEEIYGLRAQGGGGSSDAEVKGGTERKKLFDVYMVGDEDTKEMKIRYEDSVKQPWSNAVGLELSGGGGKPLDVKGKGRGPLSLCTMVVPAPRSLGGDLGVKLVCLVNRYTLINFVGREMEIIACEKGGGGTVQGRSTMMPSGMETKVPLHFNDNMCVRIRPTEYGWNWSGPFMIKRKRHDENAREVVLRLVNELSGNILIIAIELRSGDVFGGVDVAFRVAEYPPFRIENHTFCPLRMYQDEGKGGMEVGGAGGVGVVLLPYHSASYAWDYPDMKKRRLIIETAAGRSGSDVGGGGESIGQFGLDSLAPSSSLLETVHGNFAAQIIAEGPSRVLRLSDANMPKVTNAPESGGFEVGGKRFEFEINLNISRGIGVSLIDGNPQELLFIKLGEITARRFMDGKGGEEGEIVVKGLGVDNQLWVTPYPALLRSEGIKTSWKRDLRFRNSGVMSVSLVKELNFVLQPVELRVDGGLVLRLADMVRRVLRGGEEVEGLKEGTIEWDGGEEGSARDEVLIRTLGLAMESRVGREGGGGGLRRVRSRKGGLAVVGGDGVEGGLGGGGGGGGRGRGQLLKISAPQAAHYVAMMKKGLVKVGGGAEEVGGTGVGGGAEEEGGRVVVERSDRGTRRKVYFEKLTVEPIDVNLSFVLPPSMVVGGGKGLGKLGLGIVGLLGVMNLTTVQNATMSFRAYNKEHVYGTRRDHFDSVFSSFAASGLRQSYMLLASSELLGNPLRLLRAVGEGVNGFREELGDGWRDGQLGGAFIGGLKGIGRFGVIVSRVWVEGVGKFVSTVADNLLELGGQLLVTKVVDDGGRGTGRRLEGGLAVTGLISACLNVCVSVVSEPVANAQLVPPPLFMLGVVRGLVRIGLGSFPKLLVGGLLDLGRGFGWIGWALREGGEREGEGESGAGGGERIRAPRFFIVDDGSGRGGSREGGAEGGGRGGGKVDDIDSGGTLLTEYVEGRNVGFELLSRIGERGEFLHEGYVSHARCGAKGLEGARSEGKCFALLTRQKLLVLQRGRRGVVDVLWRVNLKKICDVEEFEEEAGGGGVKVFCLRDERQGLGQVNSQVLWRVGDCSEEWEGLVKALRSEGK
ncbi:hypothetical protein TrVE_jg11366 [Triparma verrucosa]|uniref:Chorein N-terminal domain-containing protein n=1 Tax=Triparma verrucosa TaxID=1606542 RepID=A0A9W7BB64_9STRA|nr:hypothetical protein TrVE_jg11366 [Triparma verrucosa]